MVWLAASAALILGFPKAPQASQTSAGSSAAPSSAPVETLTAEQRAEWEAWLDAQPRKPEAMPTGATKVLVLKFNDYQCPSCRLAWILYKDIIAKYEKANPGVFMFENRDYPLETECGAGNAGHVAACEAAAAVRMAREKSRHQELEAALFERQSPTMTRDEVVSTLQQVAQISKADFDSKYAKTLESVRADVQLGQKLGVSATPTFFLNGIQLPSLRPAYFDAAIDWALRKVQHGLVRGLRTVGCHDPTINDGMDAIKTEGLTKHYKVGFWRPKPYVALDSLNLSVAQGEVFGFLGPNGAGKTTTLKLLMQLIYPDLGPRRDPGPTGRRCRRPSPDWLPAREPVLLRQPVRRGTARLLRADVRLLRP